MGAENLGYLAQLLGGLQQGKLLRQKRELSSAQLEARKAEAEQKKYDRAATRDYRAQQLALQRANLDATLANSAYKQSGADNFIKLGQQAAQDLQTAGRDYTGRISKKPSKAEVEALVREARGSLAPTISTFQSFLRNPALARAYPGMDPETVRGMMTAGIPAWMLDENAAIPEPDYAANYNWERTLRDLNDQRKRLGEGIITDPNLWRQDEARAYKGAIQDIGDIDTVVDRLGPMSGLTENATRTYLKTGKLPPMFMNDQQQSMGREFIPAYDPNTGDMIGYQDELGQSWDNPDLYQSPELMRQQFINDSVRSEQNVNAINEINDMLVNNDYNIGGILGLDSPIDPESGIVQRVSTNPNVNVPLNRPQKLVDAAKLADIKRQRESLKLKGEQRTFDFDVARKINDSIASGFKADTADYQSRIAKSTSVIKAFEAANVEKKTSLEFAAIAQKIRSGEASALTGANKWLSDTDKNYNINVNQAVENVGRNAAQVKLAPGFGVWFAQGDHAAKWKQYMDGKISLEDLNLTGNEAFIGELYAVDIAKAEYEDAVRVRNLWRGEARPRSAELLKSLIEENIVKPKPAAAAKPGAKPAAGGKPKPTGAGAAKPTRPSPLK